MSLTLDRGDAIAIMGPSGSGKSTLLYILGALDPPTSGSVTIDGQDPFALSESRQAAFRNKRIGFVFQDHSLLPQCSVLENVLTPTLVAPPAERDASKDESRARELLQQVGLGDRLEHRPGELSGGEKQRAAIARALIRDPQVLLCDEPTGNLDRASADVVASLLLDMHARRQTVLVVVTHSVALAERFPRRYEMSGGTLGVTLSALVRRSVTYHWRTNLAVILGVAAAVSVLAGALVVGDSVRGSLRDIALGRLGRTDQVVASSGFFRDALATDLRNQTGVTGTAPLIIANGFVTHEASGRRAAGVLVYGVDERFWQFNGLDVADGVYTSPALATELGAKEGDVLLTRLQRPSEIPIESLFGRKDEVGRTVRLTVTGVQPRERLGEFALQPQQTEVRAVFAPLRRIQRDLAVPEQVNTVLVSGAASLDTLRSTLKLEDLGARVEVVAVEPRVAVESASGIISEELEQAALRASKELGLAPLPVFTYLANSIRKGDRQVPYSLITAIDLSKLPPATTSRPVEGDPANRLILNDWAARELGAVPGDRLEIDYYLWDPAGGLRTQSASFPLEGIVPIAGLAADRTLAPDYPGITNSPSLADWDPPFPVDLSRVRDQDEKYWDVYRATPKAFITYERGRDLWRTRYGAMTSIRFCAFRPGRRPKT